MRDLRAMGETNALIDRHRKPAREILFARAPSHLRRPLPGRRRGRIHATFEVIFLTGWAPHESQQKPLRPGSAQGAPCRSTERHTCRGQHRRGP
jgi:hypothetical protein